VSARNQILAKIKQNIAPKNPLPNVPIFAQNFTENELIEKFTDVLNGVGGKVMQGLDNQAITTFLQEKFSAVKIVVTSQNLKFDKLQITTFDSDKYDLEKVDLAILKGQIGVAENAAIWLPESEMLHRALPFITQHLVLILNKKDLVWNMHEAYKKISPESYGVFISGPSKTADIEQSLVIGAHGARSLMVFLV
jgi:L-lactate dehydrogenase complex protein LldG